MQMSYMRSVAILLSPALNHPNPTKYRMSDSDDEVDFLRLNSQSTMMVAVASGATDMPDGPTGVEPGRGVGRFTPPKARDAAGQARLT